MKNNSGSKENIDINMEALQRLYPRGIQTFSKIREGNYLYIDKTEYIYQMTHSASVSYTHLSRLYPCQEHVLLWERD